MSESVNTLNGRESAEQVRPTFDTVAATTPLQGGGTAEMLAYRLTGGTLDLSLTDLPPGVDIRPSERVIKYIPTPHEIVRIDPDGAVTRIDLQTSDFEVDRLGDETN